MEIRQQLEGSGWAYGVNHDYEYMIGIVYGEGVRAYPRFDIYIDETSKEVNCIIYHALDKEDGETGEV